MLPSKFGPEQLLTSAAAIRDGIASRLVSATELMRIYADHYEKVNPHLNAIVVKNFDEAFARAWAADKALDDGQLWGPLHGLPMTVKESYDLVGFPTTWGLSRFKDRIPDENSEVVCRLMDAGAIIFGKTNVAEGLADWQTDNEVYGRTHNPWDLARTPGGSSGGAAAAVASGLTALEMGSDIGGSLRNPAHYCGVYSHKPTFGIVPQGGETFPGTRTYADLSCNGPIARSVEDLVLALKLTAAPSRPDSVAWSFGLPNPRFVELQNARVAIAPAYDGFPVSKDLRASILHLAEFLSSKGAKVNLDPVLPAPVEELYRIGVSLLRAATSSRLTAERYIEQSNQARMFAPGDSHYRALMSRGTSMSHRQWLELQEDRSRLLGGWGRFFKEFDVLLCPAAASPAPEHNPTVRHERLLHVDEFQIPEPNQLLWAVMTGACYLPSTVAPIGQSSEGLPIGVQIVSARYQDRTTLQMAKLIEAEYRRFVPPPWLPSSHHGGNPNASDQLVR